jgi:hypothetical protein
MLSKSAIKALNRIGDLLLPQNGKFPSFSQTGCANNAADVTNFAPEEDIALLNLVLSLLSIAPTGILRWLLKQMDQSHDMSEPLGTVFRQLNFGLKGIIYGLYYGDKSTNNNVGNPVDIIDFRINRIEN